MLAGSSTPQPPTYLRNIQTGKSKEKLYSVGGDAGGERELGHSLLLM